MKAEIIVARRDDTIEEVQPYYHTRSRRRNSHSKKSVRLATVVLGLICPCLRTMNTIDSQRSSERIQESEECRTCSLDISL